MVDENSMFCGDCEKEFHDGDKLFWLNPADSIIKPVCELCVEQYK